MKEFFSHPDVARGVIAIAPAVIALLGVLWYKAFELRLNNELKQSMLERGMSAQEIQQVMNAGGSKAEKHFNSTGQVYSGALSIAARSEES